MKTIVVGNRKGGTGKSTILAHLGVAAAEDGERVVLIDTDPQDSVADWGVACASPSLRRSAARWP